MKQKKHLFISVLLVAVIMAGMVIPAVAVSGIVNGYEYTYTVTRAKTSGTAHVAITSAAPAYVKTHVKNEVYNELNDMTFYPEDSNTGYITSTVTVPNKKKIDGYWFDGVLKKTMGDCWVNGTQVAVGVYGKYVG